MGVGGVMAFAAGFLLLWAVAGLFVGNGTSAASTKAEIQAQVAYASGGSTAVTPLANLRIFRDASYAPIKGIYVTSSAIRSTSKLQQLISLADTTEINAFVIDVKDDYGWITYDADVQFATDEKLVDLRIASIDTLVATMQKHNIVPIARIVCFKDTLLANKRPDLAVKVKGTGSVWENNKTSFLNPYNHQVWEYLVQVAEDAARHGFREIQFDYVRFPSEGDLSKTYYPGQNSSKEDAIAAFLAYARPRLEKMGVWISADVFGQTVQIKTDSGIGQRIEKIAENVDVVCPMVYPSHYSTGNYGLADPNRSPYELVSHAMSDTKKRLAGTGAKGRPWLQDFSYKGVSYGVAEVKAQIKAAEEAGFDEWLLWNASSNYTVGALRSEGG